MDLLNSLGVRELRTGLSWADWHRPDAIERFLDGFQVAGPIRREEPAAVGSIPPNATYPSMKAKTTPVPDSTL